MVRDSLGLFATRAPSTRKPIRTGKLPGLGTQFQHQTDLLGFGHPQLLRVCIEECLQMERHFKCFTPEQFDAKYAIRKCVDQFVVFPIEGF